MKSTLSLAILVFISICSAKVLVRKDDNAKQQEPQWWEHTVVYQVYPRSFQDSDGDGTGDLKGIESRLDYFVDIGVETIWISPIYKSPMKDFGYDISDFTDIDPLFGTMQDFEDLLAGAHSRGLKIVMDYVPNHSSNEHEWFGKSVLSEDPYTDYYVWEDPIGFDNDTGAPIPPNNWVSVFRGPAWEFDETRQQFYLHQFLKEQPDLNYRNPLVVQEMNQVLQFWLDKGVDGFRFDAVAFIWEDDQLRNEPPSNNPEHPDPEDYEHWNHIYTNNLPETRQVLLGMYQTIKNYTLIDGFDRVEMLEVYLPLEELYLYYECGDFPFNFDMIGNLPTNVPVTANAVDSIIRDWSSNFTEGQVVDWVLGNHDNWRVGSRLGEEVIDIMNVITMTLPGVAVTYQGEEIGMLNNEDISFEETVDPAGCNCGIDEYDAEYCSRDPERTPMQWSAQENAGFCDPGVTPWLPVNDNYVTLNVEAQQSDPTSHLAIYKSLVQLRRAATFLYGTVGTMVSQSGNSLAIGRFVAGQPFYDTFATVINFSDVDDNVNIYQVFNPVLEDGLVEISTLGSAGYNPAGTVVDLNSINLRPKEALVIRLFDLP